MARESYLERLTLQRGKCVVREGRLQVAQRRNFTFHQMGVEHLYSALVGFVQSVERICVVDALIALT